MACEAAAAVERAQILEDAIDLAIERADATGTVMVAKYRDVAAAVTRHLKLRFDSLGQPYILTGRYGKIRRYLADMASADIIDRKRCIVRFYET